MPKKIGKGFPHNIRIAIVLFIDQETIRTECIARAEPVIGLEKHWFV